MTAFCCEYAFDELILAVNDRAETGMLLYGRADLTSAGEGYDGEFYVSAIRLDGGAWLSRTASTSDSAGFEAELFLRIAAVLENDRTMHGRHAAAFFAFEFEQARSEAGARLLKSLQQGRTAG
jgi:hypothetical protein